ncbi:glycosyl transferase family 2-domain-containing protein [Kockiozyma suomiensis]|uniref:glycosyl transferase family 2-domain-containing protein n=1 Tax=Kockiozyma suomiensis TaxID=1337062 RepID=UPI00334372AC
MAIENSIIVPAYHEHDNIRPLTKRLFAALESEAPASELIFVDDNSKDGSVEEVAALKAEGFNVSIIVRTKERGLSSAVVKGFMEASGKYLVCMDADLQHPPERVPALLHKLHTNAFVLGTRYAPGVEMDKDWPLYRRVISSGARMLAMPLTTVSDPMSGFFGIQKSYVTKAADQINAHGFKIALDILVKTGIPSNSIAEVPFSFGVRTVGESKLTGKVMVYYLDQLKELYMYKFGPTKILAAILSVAVIGVLLLVYLVRLVL